MRAAENIYETLKKPKTNETMTKRKTKKWKAYFLEFILLFLAVSLGFMADNFREKRSDRTKEKEYMQSMIEDVAADRINIKEVIDRNSQRISYLDSLLTRCFNYSATDRAKLELNKYFPKCLDIQNLLRRLN